MTINTSIPRTLLSLSEEIATTEQRIAELQVWLDELREREMCEVDPMEPAMQDAGFVAWLRRRG